MAILRASKKAQRLEGLRDNLVDILKPSHATFTGVSLESFAGFEENGGGKTLGSDIESVSAALSAEFSASFEHFAKAANIAAGAKDGQTQIPGFGQLQPGTNTQYDAALAAASLVAMAMRDPKSANDYQKAALNTNVSAQGATGGIVEFSANPSLGYMSKIDPKVSLEAFDARNLEELRAFSVIFAFSAAIQDEFGEAFFQTITLSPDSTGLEVSQRRTMVQQEIRHPLTGEAVDWKQRNLLDAISDPTIVINEATRIYPQVLIGNAKSEQHFVDAAVIAPAPALGAGGSKINVAPLKAGAKVNLLGAGANDRTNGTPDQTDAIDQRVTIEAVYLRIKTASGESIVRFDTRSFAQNGFNKSLEGRDRRIMLDFPTRILAVNAQTEDYVTKAPAAALGFLGTAPYENVTVSLGGHFTGEGNLQFGTITVNGAQIGVEGARVVRGPHDYDKVTDETTMEDLTSQFQEIEFLGYDVKAYYANTNKRFLGLLLDSVEERVRYVVPLSPPISVQTPITGTATATDMAGPMNAQRIVNSINAVTKILENVEILRNVVPTIAYGMDTDEAPAIEGFGRVMVRPAFFDEKLNIANVISSSSSATRTQDVQAAIVNKIRYGVAHIFTESRLQPAIDAMNGTAGERPELVIGTDPKIASYIMVNGDPRIVGLGFETKVVVTYDVRFRGKIYGSFVRKKTGDVDILSHGVFAYIPELVTQAQIPFNGATTNVTQVQNRNLHVIFLPVALYIEVEGLEQAASQQVGLPMTLV